MVSLFTKSPLPRRVNSKLLHEFGYSTSKGKRELHCTLKANSVNTLKGIPAFIIGFNDDRVEIQDSNKASLCYWDKKTLKESFEHKYPGSLLYVKANSQGKGSNEEFWFNEAWLLEGFSFENFIRSLQEGIICIDIRIGTFPNGKPHDHGTGFRVLPAKLDLCFNSRISVI